MTSTSDKISLERSLQVRAGDNDIPLYEEPWKQDALCRKLVKSGDMTPDDWFPDRASGYTPRRVHSEVARLKQICKQCPVLAECREYALQMPGRDNEGVFAALTVTERRALRNQLHIVRKRALQPARRQSWEEGDPPTVEQLERQRVLLECDPAPSRWGHGD